MTSPRSAAGPPASQPAGPSPARPSVPYSVPPAAPVPTRRAEILSVAAEMFARHGYRGTTIDDLGAALGLTGPALYRHFRNKEALLAEMLLDISERLLAEGRTRVASAATPQEALTALLNWHIGFALDEPSLITVHERELGSVPAPQRREVRRLQRAYAQEWAQVLQRIEPAVTENQARAAVHAVFGLLNSTPHSASELDRSAMASLLHAMAASSLAAVVGSEIAVADLNSGVIASPSTR